MTPLVTFLVVVGAIALELLTSSRLYPQLSSSAVSPVEAPVCIISSPCAALLACPVNACQLAEAPAPLPRPADTCEGGVLGWMAHWAPDTPHSPAQHAASVTPPAAAPRDAPAARPAWALWAEDACTASTTLPRMPTSLPAAELLTSTVSPAFLGEGWIADGGSVVLLPPPPPAVDTDHSAPLSIADLAAPTPDTTADLAAPTPGTIDAQLLASSAAQTPDTPPDKSAVPVTEPLHKSTAASNIASVYRELAASATDAAAAALRTVMTNEKIVDLQHLAAAASPAALAGAAVATAIALAAVVYLLSRSNRRSPARRSTLRLPSTTVASISLADLQAAAVALLPASPLRLLASPARSLRDAADEVALDELQQEAVVADDDVDGQPDTATDQDRTHTPLLVADAKARRSAGLRAMTDAVLRKTAAAAPSPRAPRSSRAAPKSAAALTDDRVDSPVVYGGDVAPSPAGGRVLRVRNTVRYS